MQSGSVLSSRRPLAAAYALLFAVCSADALLAQASPPPSHWEPVNVRSGVHANPSPVEAVVWRDFVTLPQGTPWLRLYFNSVHLDKGSYVRFVSLRDGDFMTMRQEHMEQWGNSSCFLNGNSVMVEIIAGPRTEKNFIEIHKAMAGDPNPVILPPETICGPTDDRTPSSDVRVGRINTIGCTGWIIDLPATGANKLHLSAGHCFANGQVLQFAVPASNANCSLVMPPAAKQFAIDSSTSQQVNGGVGNDYWVFRCFANSTTGRTTFEEQGAAFQLSTVMPAVGATLRNYGYGLDGTNTNGASGANASCSCTASAGTGTRNQTQQTHTGPVIANAGTTLNHQVDTCGGNSGSPLIDNTTGLAVAIHTHGGCVNPAGTSANAGTQITAPNLQTAIRAMAGAATTPNDECANAILVDRGLNGPFDNTGATLSGSPFACGFAVGRDVWFRLSTCAGSYTISTCSAARTMDTVMELYSGSCSGLTLVACNDDGGGCGLGSTITSTLVAGTYFIRVGGYNGGSGTFELDITTPCKVNDDCANAQAVGLGISGPYSNTNSSTSPPAWACASGGADCWFYYDVPGSNTQLTITTCNAGSNFDTALQAFSGTCGNLTNLACNDDMGSACTTSGYSIPGRMSRLVLTPPAGRLYFRVGGFASQRGTFFLDISQAPVNEECLAPVAVQNGLNGPFSTVGATTSTPAWPCAAGGSDAWFSYTATCTGNLVVSTCTAARTYDTALQVFSGDCNNLVSLGCNDDAGGACGLGSTLSVPVTFGQTYLIRLGGFASRVGTAELDIACVNPRDECATASVVVDGVNGPFSSQFATTSAPAWPCAGGGNDVWFRYTAQCTCPHTISTCTATRTFDTALQIFDGGCAALNSLGCNDDACSLGSRLTVNMVQGTTYHIRVGGFFGATGTFDLTVEPGTGTGSIVTTSAGCGSPTISVTGAPRIGGTVTTNLSGIFGLPFIGLGFNLTNAPFCGCTIGHDWAAANFGTVHVLNVPCRPVFIGNQIEIQGADFFGNGGCPNPRVSFTDTVRVTIG